MRVSFFFLFFSIFCALLKKPIFSVNLWKTVNWLMPLVSYALIMSCRKRCKLYNICYLTAVEMFMSAKKLRSQKNQMVFMNTNHVFFSRFCLKLCVNSFGLSLYGRFFSCWVMNTWLSRFEASSSVSYMQSSTYAPIIWNKHFSNIFVTVAIVWTMRRWNFMFYT